MRSPLSFAGKHAIAWLGAAALLAGALCLGITNCGPSPGTGVPADEALTTVNVAVAEQLRQAAGPGLAVVTATRAGSASGDGFRLMVNADRSQLVATTNAEGELVGLALTAGSAGASSTQIDASVSITPLSTAAALVALTPGMALSANPAFVADLVGTLDDITAVTDLAAVLEAQLASDGALDLESDEATAALEAAVAAACGAIYPHVTESAVTVDPQSSDGIEVLDIHQTAPNLDVLYRVRNNRAIIWAAYTDGDDPSYVWFAKTRDPGSLGDLLDILAHPDNAVTGAWTSPEWNCLLDASGAARVTLYSGFPVLSMSLGVASVAWLAHPERFDELRRLSEAGESARCVGPTLLQLAFQVVLPTANLVTGLAPSDDVTERIALSYATRVPAILAKALNRDPSVGANVASLIGAMVWDLVGEALRELGYSAVEWLSGVVRGCSAVVSAINIGRAAVDQLQTPLHSVFDFTDSEGGGGGEGSLVGLWDIVDSVDDYGIVWTGSTLHFIAQEQEGTVLHLEGYFDWLGSDDGGYGREYFHGTVDLGTMVMNLEGYRLENSWKIMAGPYTAHLASDMCHIVDGTWTGGVPGVWSAVRR